MQTPTGFENQGYFSGNCGQRSLVHALLLLGIPITEEEAHKFTDVPKWLSMINGTDEKELLKGIREMQCNFKEYRLSSGYESKKQIDELLSKGIPVIISTDDEDHWAVLAGKNGIKKYFWIDSADSELYGTWDWERIEDWMMTIDDEDQECYYFIAVKPKNKQQIKHSIVKNFSQVYDLFDDNDLAEYWGYYLEDLLESFDCPPANVEQISAKEFFIKYGKIIYDATCYYYIDTDEDKMEWELENYFKVATQHKLTLSVDKIPDAIANISAALMVINWYEG